MLSLYKELNYHTKGLSHILILKDGRLSSSAADNTLIIYNKDTFEPDIIIREHTNYVNYHIQLKNENIVTCSWDNTLKIIKLIPNNKYEVIQVLEGHTFYVDKALETEDGKLITSADDKYVIIWKKNENNNLFEIEKKFIISEEDCPNANIIFINDNLLLCSSMYECRLSFFEVKNDFQFIFSFTNIYCCFSRNSILYLKEKDLLLVGGRDDNGIYLFKFANFPKFIGKYNICDFIDEISIVYCIILNSEGDILIGLEQNNKNNICKFKINENNEDLIFVNKHESAHEDLINGIIDWKERDFIVSCSRDQKVKIWKVNNKGEKK